MEDLSRAAGEIADWLRAERRWLHAHAETGFQLPQTVRHVADALAQMGLQPVQCGRCGLVADVGVGERFVLLRADMDALPIGEEADLPFACRDGRMHACGHDMHTAMLLGASRLLKAREGQLPGRVRLMFQPAEEILSGAADMLADGLLEDGRCVGAYMLHVLTGVDLPTGTAIVSAPGVSAPAAAFFRIAVQGKGCHGAQPHNGVDPLLTAARIALGLQHIRAGELPMAESAVLTLGMLRAGESANVIPDRAEMAGSLRAFSDEALGMMLRRAEEIATGVAQAFRARAAFSVTGRAPTLLNDAELSQRAMHSLTALLGEACVKRSDALGEEARRNGGSEDFAHISHAAPALMVALAAGRPQDGHVHPAHHPQATFDEAALPIGAAAYAALALSALG
ncbi:MAG: amidohydrolase [Clostridia bacterium]|nr:amidohydrolase [Clostridia bacterium]